MRKIAVIALLLCGVMTALAQGKQYQRSELTVKSQQVKNNDGEVTQVNVGIYAGTKCIDTFPFELEPAIPKELAETIGTVSEEDLNFDGYHDADIYLGYLGGFASNTYHEGLLWDQQQHRFVKAEGYGEIGEPTVDEDIRCIRTVMSAGPDQRESCFYRWEGNRLVHYLSDVWAMDDDEVIDFRGVLNLPTHRLDGNLDGRIPVNIVFQRQDNIVAGFIYYPKAKHPAPIFIAGSVMEYDGADFYFLREYQDDGIITGIIRLKMQTGSYPEILEGSWTNPKTEKEMTMTNLFYSHRAPKWFTQSPLTSEDPGNIGKEYSFQQWEPVYESMMGGHISFRAAGKNKVHFECGNVRRNIAEGSSDDDRPAVLKGNKFEYLNVNECGYGFRATFFPHFVFLETITDNNSLECFGMGASFDGVYIKVKQ